MLKYLIDHRCNVHKNEIIIEFNQYVYVLKIYPSGHFKK